MIQAIQEMIRIREIAILLLKHGLGDKVNFAKLKETVGIRVDVEATPEAKARTAPERFRWFLTDLGTTFIKFGQILSTRVDLLPPEYIQELSKLQDDVSPVPFEKIRGQIENSFGKPLNSLFKSFEETPLACASIAQVHKAVTLDGQSVVVKVQRPGIGEKIRADMMLLKRVAKTAEAVFEESSIYSPIDLVDAFESSIKEELDCTLERDNLIEFSHLHRGRKSIVVPNPHLELCSPLVVTMDLVEGQKLRTCSSLSEAEKQNLTNILVEETYDEIFLDGVFHADPHPGNLLYVKPGKLGIIDLGAVGRLDSTMRENLLFLMMAVALKDADTVTRIVCRIAGDNGSRTDLIAFRGEVQSALDRYLCSDMTLDRIDAGKLIPELMDIAMRRHIRIPRNYTLLCRSAVILEGVLQKMAPGLNLAETLMPYAKKTLMGRYEKTDTGMLGLRALLRVQTLATDLPMQISQILMDLERGRFQVTLSSEELTQINASLKGLGVIIFLGFLACGLTIGIFMSLSKMNGMVFGMPLPAVFSSIAIGLLFGIVLAWSLYSGKGFKLKLGKLLGRFTDPEKRRDAANISQESGASPKISSPPAVKISDARNSGIPKHADSSADSAADDSQKMPAQDFKNFEVPAQSRACSEDSHPQTPDASAPGETPPGTGSVH